MTRSNDNPSTGDQQLPAPPVTLTRTRTRHLQDSGSFSGIPYHNHATGNINTDPSLVDVLKHLASSVDRLPELITIAMTKVLDERLPPRGDSDNGDTASTSKSLRARRNSGRDQQLKREKAYVDLKTMMGDKLTAVLMVSTMCH